MDLPSPQDQEIQKEPDPNVYKTEEDDEDEIDRRIRRADERLRRLTIVGAPEFNDDFLCEDTLTVEGGYDTGYAVNYVDCGAAASNQGGGLVTGACCADDGSCTITTEAGCTGTYQGNGTVCDPNPCVIGCTHAISFSVKFDQSEIDNDDSALLELRSVGAVFTLSANSSGWDFGGASVSGPWVADTWLDVSITITRGATNLIITLCVDGTCGTNTGTGFLTDKIFDTLRIGVPFGGMVVHHSCKNIIATGVGSETAFRFPPDSFDSLTAGATITTDGGDIVIRLDSDAAAVYGEKDLTTPWRLSCPGACCGDDACFTLSPYECFLLGGFYQGDRVPCDPDPCPSGACCNGDGFEFCLLTGPVHCESIGGHYYDGATCDPSPCPSPPPPAYCCRTGTISVCIPDGECGTATGPGCHDNTDCGEGSSCITWTTYEWRLVVNCDACNTEIGETCSESPCARGGTGGCCYETGDDDYGAGACPSGGAGAFLPPP